MTEPSDYLKQYEEELLNQGFSHIGGVDEVGRGPLAGPVIAACVVLPRDFNDDRINDSKKLSEKKREVLDIIIRKNALAYSIEEVSPEVIDEINILEATKKAMAQAILAVDEQLKDSGGLDFILIDALSLEDIKIPQKGIIKGDSKSISIASASIIAKVHRDNLMKEMDAIYPGYEFYRHKGYGTKLHYEKLNALGPSEIHRRSFLKNYAFPNGQIG